MFFQFLLHFAFLEILLKLLENRRREGSAGSVGLGLASWSGIAYDVFGFFTDGWFEGTIGYGLHGPAFIFESPLRFHSKTIKNLFFGQFYVFLAIFMIFGIFAEFNAKSLILFKIWQV